MSRATSSTTGLSWRWRSITASIHAPAGVIEPLKGKFERPLSYIRKDFFLARSFRNLDDLNAQLQLARQRRQFRLHAATQKTVWEAFTAVTARPAAFTRHALSMRCSSWNAASAMKASSRSAATTTACRIGRGAWSRFISFPT